MAGPGVRIADSALEEIGDTTGRFRLVVDLKTWHVYTSFGVDNLGSSAVGPWQTYATGAFNSYLLPGDTLALNLSTIANDPRELAFGRLSYDVPVGTDGIAARRVRALQRGSARRHQAPVQRRHQDRVLRDPRQHRSAAIAELDADADRGGGLQQRLRDAMCSARSTRITSAPSA